jgi:hypothetical protein
MAGSSVRSGAVSSCPHWTDPALGQPRRLPDGTVEFISTRPGRVDKAVELTYMEPNDKKLMAHRILGEYEEEYLKLVEFVDRFPDLQETPAQFQERCGQIALAAFWRAKSQSTPVVTLPTVAADRPVPCNVLLEPICCVARKSHGPDSDVRGEVRTPSTVTRDLPQKSEVDNDVRARMS